MSKMRTPPFQPYYEHAGITIYHGDTLAVLREMDAESVNCVVTSPPYWGLRDYGTALWEGGDAACDHRHPAEQRQLPHGDGRVNDCYADNRVLKSGVGGLYRDRCGKCGAIRIDRQLGLEKTPQEYVVNLVEVFREVRRVLRRDGTCWVNLGDSYANDGKWGGETGGKAAYLDDGSRKRAGRECRVTGLKPKDMVGIPWRIAFALQEDGWWLRQDIIWSKPNPMPESVTDRCTKAHEYIFLLSKSAHYYYNQMLVKEAVTGNAHRRGDGVNPKCAGWNGIRPKQNESFSAAVKDIVERRNLRSVWTIPTETFPEAHFATFPQRLVERCVLAGCPSGGVVLDPFMGSGTTCLVARRLQCRAIGIELNRDYIDMAKTRLAQEVLEFSHD